MFKRILIISLILFQFLGVAQTQQRSGDPYKSTDFSFKNITIEDGLSQNSVISIAQDSTGYLWFATQDGLNRYDGNEFKHYDKQFEDITRPTYSRLGKIYITTNGKIFIITLGGKLEFYNPENDKFSSIPHVENVSYIYEISNGKILIGTYNNGLYVANLSDNDFSIEKQITSIRGSIYDIIEWQNHIYLCTENAIYKGDSKTQEWLKIPFLFEDKRVNFSCLEVHENRLLIGSHGNSLFQIKLGFNHIESLELHNFPSALNIQDIMTSTSGNILIATYGNGLYTIDNDMDGFNNYIYQKHDPSSISYNDVLCIYEDLTGTLWFGTDGGGASYYDKFLSKFKVLTNQQVDDNVNLDVIRSITTDSFGNIYAGTSGKGLSFITPEKAAVTYNSENSDLKTNRIVSLFHDGKNLYVGHQGGGMDISNSDGKFQRIVTLDDFGLSQSTIWSINPLSNNKLLIGTRDEGLLIYDKNIRQIEVYNSTNSHLKSNNIRIAISDNHSNVWIGTDDEGLFKLNPTTKTVQQIDEVREKIKSLLVDENNILWIGTNGDGLIQFDIETESVIRKFTAEDGLANDVIYGVLPQNENSLWLSSNRGLSHFDLLSKTFRNYDNYDGLQGLEFNTGAYHKGKDGTLYFGGLNGLNWFNPNEIALNPIIPKTIITKVEVFGKPVSVDDISELEYNNNSLTFHFSSLHFSQPERNQFSYKLENFDNEWKILKDESKAVYTKLPPGDYTFKVKSSNYDGVWNDTPAILPFKISKPWYATSLAYISYILLAAIFIYFLYNFFSTRWKLKMELALEHSESERLNQLNKFKSNLYTNISHEIRTPLTLINGPVNNQLNRTNLSSEARHDLEMIRKNADRLLDLVGQMSDLALVDSGQLRLNVRRGNLQNVIIQLIDAFQYKGQKRNITVEYELEEIENLWFDHDVIEKIISNLINNALKYAPANTSVFISAGLINDQLVLSFVNEQGNTSKKNLNKLFDRFYQDNTKSEGMGIGLALVKELVELHKGRVVVNNLNGNKIQFSITLAVSENDFSDFEKAPIANDLVEQPLEKEKKSLELDLKNILLVEDNLDIQAMLKNMLTPDYNIMLALNGVDAMENINKNLPDLILSDVMMPLMNGVELCTEIKSNVLTSHIPFIMLTAKAGKDAELEGLHSGADAYITKPFSPEILKAKIYNTLKQQDRVRCQYSEILTINPEIEISSTEQKFFKSLKTVLDKNITDPELTAESFSELMGMSRTQLHRKLKSVIGMSATEYLRHQRLKIAEQLLLESDDTINEIAYQIGFNTPSYFVKCFKKNYHCTPQDFRKSA